MKQLEEGDCFLYRYPANDNHLFIVVAKTSAMLDGHLQYVCTMISSWKEKSPMSDPACRISEGEHPFIQHDSYVAYAEVVLFDDDLLSNLLGSGKAILKDPVSDDLLRRIRESAKHSKRIAPMMLRYFA